MNKPADMGMEVYVTAYEDFTHRIEPVIKDALVDYGKKFNTEVSLAAVTTSMMDIAIMMSIAYNIEPELLLMDAAASIRKAVASKPNIQARMAALAAQRKAGGDA